MKYISKTHLIVLMILVVIVGGLLLAGEHLSRSNLPSNTTGEPVSPVGTNQESLLYGSGESQAQLEMRSKSFVIRPGQSKLTYGAALDLYKYSLIQFNQDCQLSSGSRSFSLNNEIMIDNRSSKANSFSVGGSTVVIGPYDFGFMILKEKGTSIPVGCGDNKNVATLTVQ